MQIEALRKAGVQDRHLHVEKISASAKHRPIFNWALKILRNGDVFVVWRLDRLGRDVRAIHRTLDIIRESGASVRSLTEQIDTDTPIGGFTLNLMASLAQLERDQVVMRTRAGVAAAQRRGVKFGQPPKLDDKQRAQCRKWKKEGKTVREIVGLVKSEYKIKVSHGAIQNYMTKRK